jgi:CubicO group peptidase (beta-lactamase class C family)
MFRWVWVVAIAGFVALLAPGCTDDPGAEPADTERTEVEPTSDVPESALVADEPDIASTELRSTEPPPAADTTDTTDAADAADATDASDTTDRSVVGESDVDRDFTAIDATIDDFVGTRGLDGAGFIVVDADEGVVHEHYVGVFAPERISLVASSSKMVTAGVLARLHDDGVLDLDAPVADVVEWGAGNPDVTPAQLVSNSSGLVGLLPDVAYSPYRCQFMWTGSIQECAEQIFTTPDDDAEIVPPDTQFRYGGAQWQVAGAVAEVASGKTWAELVEEIYVEPCGLATLGYNNHFAQIGEGGFIYPDSFDGDLTTLQPTDNPNMEGGMYTTTGDYAELLLMHLRGGWCGDEQVLSQTALDRLHADRIGGIYGSVGPGTGYGMGWWIDRDSGRIYDPGAYGSVPWLDLADGYGAYVVLEADAVTGTQLAGELYDPLDDVMAADG